MTPRPRSLAPDLRNSTSLDFTFMGKSVFMLLLFVCTGGDPKFSLPRKGSRETNPSPITSGLDGVELRL